MLILIIFSFKHNLLKLALNQLIFSFMKEKEKSHKKINFLIFLIKIEVYESM